MNTKKRRERDKTIEGKKEEGKKRKREEGEEDEDKTRVRIAAFNVNGMNGKVDECILMIKEQELEMLFILETWQKESDGQSRRQIIASLRDKETVFTRGKHGVALMVHPGMLERSKEWNIVTDETNRT